MPTKEPEPGRQTRYGMSCQVAQVSRQPWKLPSFEGKYSELSQSSESKSKRFTTLALITWQPCSTLKGK